MHPLPQLTSSPFPLVAFALLFGLFLTGCDEAVLGPTLRGTIEGRVLTFDDGAPVGGASVTTSPATGAFVTKQNGAFRLSNVDSGPYNVSVRKNGFRPTTLSVAVRDGETTPATIFLEQSEDTDPSGVVDAEIVNWANRTVSSDTTFVDVQYRVRNTGRTDVNAYEVYVRIETSGSAFFQEIRGEALPAAQADVASFSTFIRTETAQAVTIEDVWVEAAGS